jgi:uncharacterized repeat protein (TIGR02059 family)
MNSVTKALIPLFLLCNSLASAKTFYVSKTGSDGNPGTIDKPWATWNYAFNHTTSSDTCYFRGGTYITSTEVNLTSGTNNGTHAHPTCFFNYPGEVPILDCQSNSGSGSVTIGMYFVQTRNIYVKGLTVKNVRQHSSGEQAYGILCAANYNSSYACNNVRFENCVTHDIGGAGFYAMYYDSIYWVNCDAYNICDNLTSYDPGGWGTGFTFNNSSDFTREKTSYGYMYGCRAWNCSDQGITLASNGLCVNDNCWGIRNGFFDIPGNGKNDGEGSGWKLGICDCTGGTLTTGLLRLIRNCLAVDNEYYGFTVNDGPGGYEAEPAKQIHIYNNFAYRNGYTSPDGGNRGLGFVDYTNSDATGASDHWYRNNVSLANHNGDLSEGFLHTENNLFQSGSTVTAAYFLSLDTTGLCGARQADGSLPLTDFGKPAVGSPLIDAGTIKTGFSYNGSAPDIGWFESSSGTPAIPAYQSSAIENTTPSIVAMTYNLTLANIIPATSAFSVMVNSVVRTVSSVAISGTKVQLTLTSPVVYGDIVTVAYTKPSTNPLQTVAGGQAASLSAQSVTNNVSAPAPVYVSSVVENATPSVIGMLYSLSLANIVPVTSAFAVTVNSIARTVSSVAVSGTRVSLTLSGPVVYGDVVKVAYTKPSTNPLQTSAGGQAATIIAQSVTNNVSPVVSSYQSSAIENLTPAILEMTYNLALANIVPATSSFTVMVNSVLRTVSSVAVSGTKVLLTLSSAVIYGDIVNVAYTKPTTNPLQTASGGQTASLNTQSVTNRVSPPAPVYVSSVVQNATPSVIEITYSLSLDNIVPAASAFSVMVNSSARTVSSVTVSGTKVSLTLSGPVIYGDMITVTYTKPSTNPLQTSAGGQAATISAQSVTNNVSPAVPSYQSSAIENLTPAILEMTYNLALANIVPATSAFTVMVNSVVRTVSSVAVSGTKVLLTLSSAVIYGDIVTVAYTKPSTNPLQTASGGQAASFSTQPVTNKIGTISPLYVSSSVENTASSVILLSYNLALATNFVPSTTAFTIIVNSAVRTVNSVTISGTNVFVTLISPVIFGDEVTIGYNVPSVNPLQTPAGGQASTLVAQSVTNNVHPLPPVYVSSVIENATPSELGITYSLPLAHVVPPASAFIVLVNSIARGITTVVISDTKVLLTLSSPIVYGDVVTITYIKPEVNPLQTISGGQAETISSRPVTNGVNLAIPVFTSASVENSTPSRIDMNYSLGLANIIPATSAFIVLVNSSQIPVIAVTISGAKVLLSLAGPVFNGDILTLTYTKPASNPLQTASGGQAVSLNATTVANNVTTINMPPVIVVNYKSSSYSGFVSELNASGSYDQNKDNLTFAWTVPDNVPVSSLTGSTIQYLGPSVNSSQTVEFVLRISDGKTTESKVIPIKILPYKPELEVAEISNVEASSFLAPYYPYNIIDGNIGTMWSANGDNQWLIMELKHPFDIQHVKLAFQPGQKRESYFDILGSVDKVAWEPILTKSASCAFSGDPQVFEFPASKTGIDFNYVKIVGRCSSTDTWNYISELKIFGTRHLPNAEYEKLAVKIYPNPAKDHLTMRIDDTALLPDFIQLLNLSGKVVLRSVVDPDIREFTIPINLKKGMYIVQLGSGSLTLFTQKLVVAN